MSPSRLRSAFGHVWVRAVILSGLSLVLFSVLCVLGATELNGGGSRRSLGGPALKLDMLLLFLVVFLGPAWVIAPSNRPPGDGPPRGGIVPFPLKTPEQTDGAGEDESPPAAA
ncbi:MAG: hypothetical protein ACXVEU_05045 [Nocardioidaceae bacterium]